MVKPVLDLYAGRSECVVRERLPQNEGGDRGMHEDGKPGWVGSVHNQIKKACAVQVTLTLLTLGSSFALFSLIGHLLGPGSLGIWSTTAALCSIVFAFSGLGVDTILCREIAKTPQSSGRILGTALAMRSAITIPLAVLLVFVLIHVFRFSGLIIVFAPIYVLYAGLGGLNGLVNKGFQGLDRFSYQLPCALSGVVGVAVVAWLLWQGHGLLATVATAAVSQGIALVVGLLLFHRSTAIKLSWQWSDWKWLFKESWPLALSMPFLAAYVRVDSVMLAAMKGTESVGFYNSGYTILMGCGGLMAAVQTAIFPSLSRMYVESPQKASEVFAWGMRWMALAGFALFGLSLLAARPILTLLFGHKFTRAAGSFEILMLAAIFLFLNNTCGMALNAIGQQKWAPPITIVGLLFNVMLNLILIPRLDYLGSSYATLATEIFVLLIAYAVLTPKWRQGVVSLGRTRIS